MTIIKKLPITLVSAIFSIMLLPLVSAQWDYVFYSFRSFYQSSVFLFILVLLFFWLVCYFSLRNVFGGKIIPASIAAIISFMITGPIIDNFGDTILNQGVLMYILYGGAAIGLFFLIKTIIGLILGKFGEKPKLKYVLLAIVAIAALIYLSTLFSNPVGKTVKLLPKEILNPILTASLVILGLGLAYLFYDKVLSRKAKEQRRVDKEQADRQRERAAATERTEIENKAAKKHLEDQQKQREYNERQKAEIAAQAEKLESQGRWAEAQKKWEQIGEMGRASIARQNLVQQRGEKIGKIKAERLIREEAEREDKKREIEKAQEEAQRENERIDRERAEKKKREQEEAEIKRKKEIVKRIEKMEKEQQDLYRLNEKLKDEIRNEKKELDRISSMSKEEAFEKSGGEIGRKREYERTQVEIERRNEQLRNNERKIADIEREINRLKGEL